MLNVFTLVNGRLVQKDIETLHDLAHIHPVWVDMESPTPEEKLWVKQHFSLLIADDVVDDDIEESARFYQEGNGELHIRSDFLVDDDSPRYVRVAFIMNLENASLRSHNVLFSIREDDVPVFRLFRLRARRTPGLIEDCKEVLLNLFDTNAEYSADSLEWIYDQLNEVSERILYNDEVDDTLAGEVLAGIARYEDLNGKIRRNMMDTRRAVNFLMRSKILSAEQFESARQIIRDIESLDSHTAFLFDKINFLLDATVGFININQNKIIKLFSVASVALLPPTLIASIYGMNFQVMPELSWRYGYVFALLFMVASALIPMLYFRRKGWLK